MSVTACRTSCLYGVSYSRASPRLFVGVTSSVSLRTAHSSRCEWGVDILSPHGALRAYTVFLTAEPRRGSSLMLSSSVTETDRTVSDVRVGRVISCHRKAYYVLVRCLNGIIIRLFLPCLKTILIKTLVIQKFFLPLQCPFAHVA